MSYFVSRVTIIIPNQTQIVSRMSLLNVDIMKQRQIYIGMLMCLTYTIIDEHYGCIE